MSAVASDSPWRYQRSAKAAKKSDQDLRGRWRVMLAMAGFGVLYATLAVRLVTLGVSAGGEMDDGRWQGWIEFESLDGAEVYRSRRETTQPNRTDLAYWATLPLGDVRGQRERE